MKKILLVEDNQDHAELIRNSIESKLSPNQIFLASGAKKALQLVQQQDFDLILADYYLPDSTGEKFIRQLTQEAPQIPLLVITGQGDEKTAARSIQAGADEYVVKTREALKILPSIIERLLIKRQAHLNKIQKNLQNQKDLLEKALKKIEFLEEEIKKINTPEGSQKWTTIKNNGFLFQETITKQVKSLKSLLEKLFYLRK